MIPHAKSNLFFLYSMAIMIFISITCSAITVSSNQETLSLSCPRKATSNGATYRTIGKAIAYLMACAGCGYMDYVTCRHFFENPPKGLRNIFELNAVVLPATIAAFITGRKLYKMMLSLYQKYSSNAGIMPVTTKSSVNS